MVKPFFPDIVLILPISIPKLDSTGPRINPGQPAQIVIMIFGRYRRGRMIRPPCDLGKTPIVFNTKIG